MLWLATFLGSEEDAVLLAWKEKINHDLVRPTTVVQQTDRYNTPEVITTFAGPGNGIDTFPVKDFQPYIRVMPHAEFPSGSSCICEAGAGAMCAFVETVFNDDASTFSPRREYVAGSSLIEPGITPAEDLVLVYLTLKRSSTKLVDRVVSMEARTSLRLFLKAESSVLALNPKLQTFSWNS